MEITRPPRGNEFWKFSSVRNSTLSRAEFLEQSYDFIKIKIIQSTVVNDNDIMILQWPLKTVDHYK